MDPLDASAFADAEALASAAATTNGRVCLTNLVVRRRKRRGAKIFFVTAAAGAPGATFDVQLSCMVKRGEGWDDTDDAARLDPEAHAAAYESSNPGAVVARAWGILERRSRTIPGTERGRSGDDNPEGTTRRCHACGQMSCAGAAPGAACPTAAPVLRCEGVEFIAADDDDAPSATPSSAPSATRSDGCWLVFDMAYDHHMTAAEHGGLSRQISMCVAANKRARFPFYVAAVTDDPRDDRDADGVRAEPDVFASSSSADTPFVVFPDAPEAARGSNSWRRLPWRRWGARCGGPRTWRDFPPDRTVYLTADSPNALESVNPGDVLVLGGVVDHKEKPECALRRAEGFARDGLDRENAASGVRTARLPLAGHVRLAKNAHLPCLAVAQTLLVFREVAAEMTARRAERGESTPHVVTVRMNVPVVRADAAKAAADEDGARGHEPGNEPVTEPVAEPEPRRGAAESPGTIRGRPGAARDHPPRVPGTILKEGGEMATAWGEALARCPAFRCAPLRKYVRWLPPYERLNDARGVAGVGGSKPSGVTDVRALAPATGRGSSDR